MHQVFPLLFLFFLVDTELSSCDSAIYCPGYILDKVQRMKIFNDEKTFVDMATNKPSDVIEKELTSILKSDNNSRNSAEDYIIKNFMQPGVEIQTEVLNEFTDSPKFLKEIKDQGLAYFSQQIVKVWPTLYRKVDKSVLCKGCESSLLDTKHPFIIPGGRFREYYYFDTFFIMEGLLLSDLDNTTKEMIENFLGFVNKYGFVPNGSRKYFLNRSQPPFLIQMMDIYVKKTQDYKFLSENLKTLEKEYMYWLRTHSVELSCQDNKNCILTRYHSSSTSPRPESYTADIEIVESVNKTFSEKQEMYRSLASATESGWDFSVRWTQLKENATTKESGKLLKTVNTNEIIPIDLNSYMYKNEILLSQFHLKMLEVYKEDADDHRKKSDMYLRNAENRAKVMEELMWDKKDLQFYDYNFKEKKLQKFFTTASYTPFWAGALTENFKSNISNIINPFKHLSKKMEQYKFGLPATEISSGLQWDYPNIWAPLVYLTGLSAQEASRTVEKNLDIKKSNASEDIKKDLSMMKNLGFVIADRYIRTVYCTWVNSGGIPFSKLSENKNKSSSTGEFYEKYSSEVLGKAGSGGEYTVQTGFGWTNAVSLYFINQFKGKLNIPDVSTCQQ